MSAQRVVNGYYINIDEREDFNADVRAAESQTVFDIRAGGGLVGEDDESSIFEGGFQRWNPPSL